MQWKTLSIGLGVITILGVGYYALSPLWNTIEVNDPAPEEEAASEEEAPSEEVSGNTSDIQEEPSENTMSIEEIVATQQNVRGPFEVMGTTGHPADGVVRVYVSPEEKIIRYEEYETINGPNLHVYLSKDLEGKEYIDLGPIKGTKGDINYAVPLDTDLSEYRYVLTWCVPFGVLFNYAEVR